jgi:hypothetical protein
MVIPAPFACPVKLFARHPTWIAILTSLGFLSEEEKCAIDSIEKSFHSAPVLLLILGLETPQPEAHR